MNLMSWKLWRLGHSAALISKSVVIDLANTNQFIWDHDSNIEVLNLFDPLHTKSTFPQTLSMVQYGFIYEGVSITGLCWHFYVIKSWNVVIGCEQIFSLVVSRGCCLVSKANSFWNQCKGHLISCVSVSLCVCVCEPR